MQNPLLNQNVGVPLKQVKGVDDDDSATAWLGKDAKFGECLFEICAGGWVYSAAWSLSGTSLAFTSHDCTVKFIDGLHGKAQRELRSVTYTVRATVSLSYVSSYDHMIWVHFLHFTLARP